MFRIEKKCSAVCAQKRFRRSIPLLQVGALCIFRTSCCFPFNLAVACCCINNGLASHLWAIVAFHGAELWPSGCCCMRRPRSQTHEPTRGVRSRRRALAGRYPGIVVFDSSWIAWSSLTLKSKRRATNLAADSKNNAFPANVTTEMKLKPLFRRPDKVLVCVCVCACVI